ncbi:MAG: nucleotidyltransferase domain-containing protein [Candidatus Latescibacteria bacterium]|nr:nucleotidyltransferase domain-containing protein [Candidatus Latescibacterota bacterium]
MLDESTLDEIIRRIVEVAHPEKIILFGSAARGDLKAHSDIDLLVVKDDSDPWTVIGDIYGNLRGVGVGVDAIVVTPAQVERYKDSHALVIKPALQEGRVIYEAA